MEFVSVVGAVANFSAIVWKSLPVWLLLNKSRLSVDIVQLAVVCQGPGMRGRVARAQIVVTPLRGQAS